MSALPSLSYLALSLPLPPNHPDLLLPCVQLEEGKPRSWGRGACPQTQPRVSAKGPGSGWAGSHVCFLLPRPPQRCEKPTLISLSGAGVMPHYCPLGKLSSSAPWLVYCIVFSFLKLPLAGERPLPHQPCRLTQIICRHLTFAQAKTHMMTIVTPFLKKEFSWQCHGSAYWPENFLFFLIGEIILFNIFYEFFTICTSIITEDKEGKWMCAGGGWVVQSTK